MYDPVIYRWHFLHFAVISQLRLAGAICEYPTNEKKDGSILQVKLFLYINSKKCPNFQNVPDQILQIIGWHSDFATLHSHI